MVRRGYAAVCAAAVLWAVGGAVASRAIADGASFVELTQARAWITATVLGIVVARRGAPRPVRPPPLLLLVFGLALASVNLTYYAALALVPVAVAITVQYTSPALVVLWVALRERRPPGRSMGWALAVSFGGVALLAEAPIAVRDGLTVSGPGLVMAGLSAVAFATYMVSGEALGDRVDTITLVFWGFSIASVVWVIVLLARGRPDTLLDPRFTGVIVFLSIGTTIAPFLLFLWGLGKVRAANAAVVSTLEPLTAAVIAAVWLGQALSGWQVVGAAMVLAGITVVQARRPTPDVVLAERAAIE